MICQTIEPRENLSSKLLFKVTNCKPASSTNDSTLVIALMFVMIYTRTFRTFYESRLQNMDTHAADMCFCSYLHVHEKKFCSCKLTFFYYYINLITIYSFPIKTVEASTNFHIHKIKIASSQKAPEKRISYMESSVHFRQMK